MYIYNLYAGSWLSNCYVLISEDADGKKCAAVVDPSTDADEIIRFVEEEKAFVDKVILTHGHFDHIMSLDALRDKTGACAYIHKDDAEMLADGRKNANFFFFHKDFSQRPAENLLEHNQIIKLGQEELRVIHLPGHSKGSIALMGQGFLITGDTLFADSIGRCDLCGGDRFDLKNSLNSMKNLDPNLTIYPGHGKSEKLGKSLRSISCFLA